MQSVACWGGLQVCCNYSTGEIVLRRVCFLLCHRAGCVVLCFAVVFASASLIDHCCFGTRHDALRTKQIGSARENGDVVSPATGNMNPVLYDAFGCQERDRVEQQRRGLSQSQPQRCFTTQRPSERRPRAWTTSMRPTQNCLRSRRSAPWASARRTSSWILRQRSTTYAVTPLA